MDIKSEFEKALQDVQGLSQRPSDADLLRLYGLYKQATQGDVTGPRPGVFDIKGRKKFDSWSEFKGMATDVAMKKYCEVVSSLKL